MSDTAAVEARIARILATSLHLDIPSPEIDLFETGAVDSLTFVELLLSLEREFDIRVSLEELELDRFRSIERIAEFVATQISLDGEVVGKRNTRLGPSGGVPR